MRLLDLDPRWLMKDGRRVGIVFLSPAGPSNQRTHWRQTCFFEPMAFKEQAAAVWSACDDLKGEGQQHFGTWQSCRDGYAWTVNHTDDFDSLSIMPSIDGSAGGLWHGFITNGAIT